MEEDSKDGGMSSRDLIGEHGETHDVFNYGRDEGPGGGYLEEGHTGCIIQKPQQKKEKKPGPATELVSAMKGSREKRGDEMKKMNVTWDPSVYDPVPTSVSHSWQGQRMEKSTSKSKKNRKNRKTKQSSGSEGESSNKKCHRRLKKSEKRVIDSRFYQHDRPGKHEDGCAGSYEGTLLIEKELTDVHLSVSKPWT